jgi:hypothetical protein
VHPAKFILLWHRPWRGRSADGQSWPGAEWQLWHFQREQADNRSVATRRWLISRRDGRIEDEAVTLAVLAKV